MNNLIKSIKKYLRNSRFTLLFLNFQIKKFTFSVARKFEKEEIYKLRYKVYCEEIGYLPKERYPNLKEIDQFDDYSIVFVAKDLKNKIVGSIRIVPNKEHLLPTEEFHPEFEQYVRNLGKSAEISRLVVLPKYRGGAVTFGLIKTVILYALKNNILFYLLSCSLRHEEIYKKFGFKRIGQPYKYIGVNDNGLSITLISNIGESLKIMPTINPIFFAFLKYKHINIILE